MYLLFTLILLFGYLFVTEWKPQTVECESFNSSEVALPDTIVVVSWNIGYGGLDEQMDFFYDGGKNTRTTESRTRENLNIILKRLKALNNADFILLQEVDFDSKRSYYIDEYDFFTQSLSEEYPYATRALNYSSKFVPIPLSDPMGRVNSGLVTLSKYGFARAVRYQYPTEVGLPNRFFDLKRAMLSVGVALEGGDTLWVNNTHNTAFDSGDMRSREVAYIGDIVERQSISITAGDWNSTPPGYEATREALENDYFSPHPLSREDLPRRVEIAVGATESVRYLDRPYVKNESTTTLVDFGIFTCDFELKNCEVLDLGFKNSDHNPVIITLLRRE